jgi:hypothetical protein
VDDWWTLNIARAGHAATSLADGRIVIIGGDDRGIAVGSIEVQPATRRSSLSAASIGARTDHAAALLNDGTILITRWHQRHDAVGLHGDLRPINGRRAAGPALASARAGHSATTLLSGKVLVAGGAGAGGELGSAEVLTRGRAHSPAQAQWLPRVSDIWRSAFPTTTRC